MNFLITLAIPILLSAVLVFAISALIHMVFSYHRNDFKKLPNEDAVMDALLPFAIPEGDYLMPCPGSSGAMRSPEFLAKVEKGPVALLTMMECGRPKMGKNLAQWFVYCVLVGVFAGYICDRAVGPGALYLQVFRFVGCSAFMGYSLALCQNSIWYRRSWGATLRTMFDGLLFALITAGVFGWLWPR